MKKLIIAGTMKGGTTALYNFITTHSKVLKGTKKEIHYFTLFSHLGDEWYQKQFNTLKNEDKEYIIDASPTYFDLVSSSMIPESIKAFDPSSKIIIITRDPVSRAVSHFKHLQVVNKIPELLELSINEFFSYNFAKSITKTNTVDYYVNLVLSFSSYYRKYLIYKNYFDEKQLLVLSNEELLHSPQETMVKVYEFMGLEYEDSDLYNQFQHSNSSNISELTNENYTKLTELLYPDYELFCKIAKVNCHKTEYLPNKIPIVENDVLIGKEGWLYLYSGTNNVHKYYDEDTFFTDSLCEQWKELLCKRKNRLQSNNIDYIHLFVPDKISVYPEFLDYKFKSFNSHPIKKLFEYSSECIQDFAIDPLNYFNNVKKFKKLLYWKTDTHWTYWGSLSAFQLIMSKLNFHIPNSLYDHSIQKSELLLDLGSKLNSTPKELFEVHEFLKNAKRVYANELVLMKEKHNLNNTEKFHVGSNVVYNNDSEYAIQKKVVIFGDSFSEYRAHLLSGLFFEVFSEVHFVWSTSLNYSYINKINPDIVITEIAERFMNNVPNDNFDLKIHVNNVLSKLKL